LSLARETPMKFLARHGFGYHSARRGTYRIIYRINEDQQTVEIHSIRHRRDPYRT
jgi:mRNA-degrading endonuclease RelE of RelBE toxin-antitoxin system